MTDNRHVVTEYLREVWSDGDLTALDRYLAPDYRRHVSPALPPLDRGRQAERLAGIRAAFPDVTLHLEDLLVDGDRVAFRSTMRGTHRGAFLGLAPTGRGFTIGILDVVRIEDGRIAEHWGGPDLHDLVRQLCARVSLPE